MNEIAQNAEWCHNKGVFIMSFLNEFVYILLLCIATGLIDSRFNLRISSYSFLPWIVSAPSEETIQVFIRLDAESIWNFQEI